MGFSLVSTYSNHSERCRTFDMLVRKMLKFGQCLHQTRQAVTIDAVIAWMPRFLTFATHD